MGPQKTKPMKLFKTICDVVCKGEGYTFEEISQKSRKQEYVYCRQLIMYFCKSKGEDTLRVIGSRLAKDHSTVIYSVKAIENYIETDKGRRSVINGYSDDIDGKGRIVILNIKNVGLYNLTQLLKKSLNIFTL